MTMTTLSLAELLARVAHPVSNAGVSCKITKSF